MILQLVMKMATHFGKLERIQPHLETVVTYLECVDLFFVTNDVADNKKVPEFITEYIV